MSASIISTVLFALSFACLLGLLVRRRDRMAGEPNGGKKPPASTLAWWLTFVLVQAFLTVWSALGLVDAGTDVLLPEVVFAVAAGTLALWRESTIAWLDQTFPSQAGRALLHALLLVLAALLTDLTLEAPFNDWIGATAPFALMARYWLIECGLVLLAALAFYFLGQRHGAVAAITVPVAYLIGLAEYFVQVFKGAAILPSDVLSAGTAAAVSGGYDYTLTAGPIRGITYAILALACYAVLRPQESETVEAAKKTTAHMAKGHSPRALVANLGLGLALLACLVISATVPSYINDFGVKIEYWYSQDSYRRQGFLPSFIAVAQDLPIPMPEGYDDQRADQLEGRLVEAWEADTTDGGSSSSYQAAHRQFAQEKPTIIVVQNETFSDLSLMKGLKAGYEGPQFFKHGLSDALAQGDLYMSALGGGTCNTEFSFLTGNSMSFIGAGKYPYTLYDLEGVPSIAQQLRDQGYKTTAMHPNLPTNWNRNILYPELGFQDFLSLDNAFQDAEEYHAGVSDAATYEQVLDLLATSDQPQFIWDVTMQNHSGYDIGNIPSEDQLDYQPAGVDSPDGNAQLNEYLACIQKSDEALEDFVGKLRELDRPVILVFYGDHQPSVTEDYNDAIFGKDEYPLTHVERLYHTQYVVWANYPVAGVKPSQEGQEDPDGRATSVNYLAALTLSLAGADLTPYQKAQLACGKDMPVVNLYGYQDVDGVWHPNSVSTDLASSESTTVAADQQSGPIVDPHGNSPQAQAAKQAYEDLAWLQYRNFAKRIQ